MIWGKELGKLGRESSEKRRDRWTRKTAGLERNATAGSWEDGQSKADQPRDGRQTTASTTVWIKKGPKLVRKFAGATQKRQGPPDILVVAQGDRVSRVISGGPHLSLLTFHDRVFDFDSGNKSEAFFFFMVSFFCFLLLLPSLTKKCGTLRDSWLSVTDSFVYAMEKLCNHPIQPSEFFWVGPLRPIQFAKLVGGHESETEQE